MKRHLILLVFIAVSCGTTSEMSVKSTAFEKRDISKIVKQELGDKYMSNSKGDFTLYYVKKKNFKSLFQDITALVYDVKNNEVILRETLINGRVKWIDDHTIEVLTNDKSPSGGIIKVRYQYNVIKREKKFID